MDTVSYRLEKFVVFAFIGDISKFIADRKLPKMIALKCTLKKQLTLVICKDLDIVG